MSSISSTLTLWHITNVKRPLEFLSRVESPILCPLSWHTRVLSFIDVFSSSFFFFSKNSFHLYENYIIQKIKNNIAESLPVKCLRFKVHLLYDKETISIPFKSWITYPISPSPDIQESCHLIHFPNCPSRFPNCLNVWCEWPLIYNEMFRPVNFMFYCAMKCLGQWPFIFIVHNKYTAHNVYVYKIYGSTWRSGLKA